MPVIVMVIMIYVRLQPEIKKKKRIDYIENDMFTFTTTKHINLFLNKEKRSDQRSIYIYRHTYSVLFSRWHEPLRGKKRTSRIVNLMYIDKYAIYTFISFDISDVSKIEV